MAERNPDNADSTLSVDELRRRARRRLVGAVVIALAGAIVLPLLLETDPKPLGEDVAVKIPAVDDSRFVSRLSGKSADPAGSATATAPAATPPKAVATPEPAPAAVPPAIAAAAPPTAAAPVAAPAVPPPKKTVAEAEQRLLTPAVKAPVATQPVAKPVVPVPDPVSMPAASAPEARTAASTPESPPAGVTAAAPPPASKPVGPGTVAAPAKEGFVVQLAAYADDKGANAFAARLKKAGHPAYVEPVETSRGTLWRVRVGGFATRADADVARTRLKDEGHNGIVAAAK
jgi:DedD protein